MQTYAQMLHIQKRSFEDMAREMENLSLSDKADAKVETKHAVTNGAVVRQVRWAGASRTRSSLCKPLSCAQFASCLNADFERLLGWTQQDLDDRIPQFQKSSFFEMPHAELGHYQRVSSTRADLDSSCCLHRVSVLHWGCAAHSAAGAAQNQRVPTAGPDPRQERHRDPLRDHPERHGRRRPPVRDAVHNGASVLCSLPPCLAVLVLTVGVILLVLWLRSCLCKRFCEGFVSVN